MFLIWRIGEFAGNCQIKKVTNYCDIASALRATAPLIFEVLLFLYSVEFLYLVLYDFVCAASLVQELLEYCDEYEDSEEDISDREMEDKTET